MIPQRKLVILLGDILLLLLTGWWVCSVQDVRLVQPMAQFALAFPLAFYFAGLYEDELVDFSAMSAARLIAAAAMVFGIVAPVSYMFPALYVPRGVLVLELLAVLLLFPLWRPAWSALVRIAITPTRIAIVGAGKAATALIQAIEAHPEYRVVGVYDDDARTWGNMVREYSILGPSTALLEARQVDMVAVAITHHKSNQLISTLVDCRRRGIHVTDMVQPYELVTGRLPVEHLSDTWIAFWSQVTPARAGFFLKTRRVLDIWAALLLLGLFSIPLAISMLLIRLTSAGPVLYRQPRIGFRDQPFEILKLRTMYHDAETTTGPVWAIEKDPRVTPIGRFLRRVRIDEFPQLVNVLKGEMSLVGPRPERPEFVKKLEREVPYYALRHMVRPGVTGWAQVNYPYGSTVADALRKLEYDLYYIRHMGPIFDLRIALKTVHTLLFARGGR